MSECLDNLSPQISCHCLTRHISQPINPSPQPSPFCCSCHCGRHHSHLVMRPEQESPVLPACLPPTSPTACLATTRLCPYTGCFQLLPSLPLAQATTSSHLPISPNASPGGPRLLWLPHVCPSPYRSPDVSPSPGDCLHLHRLPCSCRLLPVISYSALVIPPTSPFITAAEF